MDVSTLPLTKSNGPSIKFYSKSIGNFETGSCLCFLGSSSPSSWHIQDHPKCSFSVNWGLFAPQISADSIGTPLVQVGSACCKIMQNSDHRPRKPCYGSAPVRRRDPWPGLWKIENGLVHLCPSLCYLCHPNPQTWPKTPKKNTQQNEKEAAECLRVVVSFFQAQNITPKDKITTYLLGENLYPG